MKKTLLTISILVLLFSCKKEEPVQQEENSVPYVGHDAYFKGMVTDSLTGTPISGYNLRVNGPKDDTDTLINGNYSLLVHWFSSQYSYPKPTEVEIFMLDSTNSIVDILTFDGNLLVEDDTIVVDFQVTL